VQANATYAVWLEPSGVRERLSVHALGLAGAVEEDVGDRHDDVVDDSTTSDQARLMLVSINAHSRRALVTHLINHPKTLLDPLLSCMNDRQGKHITTKKQ
jgi:hypothetical protein